MDKRIWSVSHVDIWVILHLNKQALVQCETIQNKTWNNLAALFLSDVWFVIFSHLSGPDKHLFAFIAFAHEQRWLRRRGSSLSHDVLQLHTDIAFYILLGVFWPTVRLYDSARITCWEHTCLITLNRWQLNITSSLSPLTLLDLR